MFKMEKPCAAKVDIELGGVEKVINRNKSNNAMCDVNGVNITSPSTYPVGHWVVDSFIFPIFISRCCWCVDTSGPM